MTALYQTKGLVSNVVVRGVGTAQNGPAVDVYGGVFSGGTVSNIVEVYNWTDVCLLRLNDGFATGCRFADSAYFGDAGVLQYGGIISNSLFTNIKPTKTNRDNFARNTLQVSAGTATHCVFTNNGSSISTWLGSNTRPGTVSIRGTGILRNSLIANNRSYQCAGLGVQGTACAENCTVYGNTVNPAAPQTGNDLYQAGGTVVNCIFWGYPDAPDNGINKTGGTVANSLVSVLLSGMTDVVVGVAPRFVDLAVNDFTPQQTCKSWNTAQTLDWMADGSTDLLGNPRVFGTAPDFGAVESQDASEPFLCEIEVDRTAAFVETTADFTFTGSVTGAPEGAPSSMRGISTTTERPTRPARRSSSRSARARISCA